MSYQRVEMAAFGEEIKNGEFGALSQLFMTVWRYPGRAQTDHDKTAPR